MPLTRPVPAPILQTTTRKGLGFGCPLCFRHHIDANRIKKESLSSPESTNTPLPKRRLKRNICWASIRAIQIRSPEFKPARPIVGLNCSEPQSGNLKSTIEAVEVNLDFEEQLVVIYIYNKGRENGATITGAVLQRIHIGCSRSGVIDHHVVDRVPNIHLKRRYPQFVWSSKSKVIIERLPAGASVRHLAVLSISPRHSNFPRPHRHVNRPRFG